jgi:hypothetical protein
MKAFQALGLFFSAANAADPSQPRTVSVPGVQLIAADQRSVGPTTISLSTTAAGAHGDVAVAIRSDSGVCIWYAYVQSQDRYGSGEPCTAIAALSGSKPDLTADSPWHLMDDRKQATAAQSTLRNALVAAKTSYSDTGTFTDTTLEKLQAIEPTISFVAAGTPSADADTVSFAIVGEAFGAAALSDNGTCYWITEDVGVSGTQYGQGTPCTGTAALAARGTSWKAGG